MTKILYIAPGDNSHTWKWVGWFGKKYPGQVMLIPYQAAVPEGAIEGVEILEPFIPGFKIASIGSWTELGRIKRLVHEIRPDLLHVLWAYGSGTYGARSDFHPMILSPWGSDITVYPEGDGLKGTIQRRLVLESLSKADRITASSEFLAGAIKKLDPNIADVEVLPYGVDTSFFDPGSVGAPMEFTWPDGAPLGDRAITVGFFKSLEPQYGPDILIEAIALASGSLTGLRAVIAGSGGMLDSLTNQAHDLGVDNRIVFPGRIPYSEMPGAYAAIDIFTMPSRYETFGVAALEASSMEKPLIVSERWGMKEVLINNESGIFTPPGDAERLAELIIQLANDGVLRKKLGRSGREFVKGKYEFESIMNRADQFCNCLIDNFNR